MALTIKCFVHGFVHDILRTVRNGRYATLRTKLQATSFGPVLTPSKLFTYGYIVRTRSKEDRVLRVRAAV